MGQKRVALIFNGLTRLHPETEARWLAFIRRYQCDVFVHTWQGDDAGLERMYKTYSPVSCQIDRPIETDITRYKDRLFPGLNAYSIFSMWTSIKRSYSMMAAYYRSTGNTPDLIVRTRFDLIIDRLDLDFEQDLVIPMEPKKVPVCIHYQQQFLVPQSDVLCYGTQSSMERYCNTLDLIPQIYESSEFKFTSENMLISSLAIQKVPFINQLCPMRLMR